MRSHSFLAVVTLSCLFPASAFAQAAPTDKPGATAATKPGDRADKPADKGLAQQAPPDLAPPPPPPWGTPPAQPATSTSGTSIMPLTPAPSPALPPRIGAATETIPTQSAEDRITLENRFQMIEQRLAADEQFDKDNIEKLTWLKKLKISGYLQPQLIWMGYNAAGSPNGAAVGQAGVDSNSVIVANSGKPDVLGNTLTTNKDFFKIRRARLKTEFMPTDCARFVMEIDPFSTGGPIAGTGTIARNVEADGIVKWTEGVTTDFGIGIFKIPFGWEVLQSDADRPFIERSFGESQLTPGEFDTGAKAYTSARFKNAGFSGKDGLLAFQLALVNGQTQGEKTFTVLPDLNKGKDLVLRLNYNFGDWIDVGVNGYYGQGETVDGPTMRFKQFPRWAFNVELGLHHEWKKDWGTRLLGEFTTAENMDRFTVPAIPTDIAKDVTSLDERNLWVRVEQDLGEYFTLAVRYDSYSPDTSIDNNQRETIGAVAVVHFTKGLQWMNEFASAKDNIHAANKPAPSKEIDMFSSVLQVRF